MWEGRAQGWVANSNHNYSTYTYMYTCIYIWSLLWMQATPTCHKRKKPVNVRSTGGCNSHVEPIHSTNNTNYDSSICLWRAWEGEYSGKDMLYMYTHKIYMYMYIYLHCVNHYCIVSAAPVLHNTPSIIMCMYIYMRHILHTNLPVRRGLGQTVD